MRDQRTLKENPVILTCFVPVMTPIIKIVGDYCNLRCDYCFYHHKEQQVKTIMDIDLLEKFIEQYLELFDGKLRFNWHGGEPLLAGMSFFESIIQLQEKYIKNTQKIVNSIQTNATLINEKWAVFFKEHNFEVGVSLDGIEKCHNRFRKNIGGKGSFKSTVRGIKILQDHKIPIGILQTLTHSNIPFTKENFKFFVDKLGLKQICTCIYIPSDKFCILGEEITNKDFTEFLKTAIDFWFHQDDPDLEIREIENLFAGANGKLASLCGFNGTCTAFFCLEYNGKVYPCDRVSNREEFCFGDLSKEPLKKILNSQERLNWAKIANFLHQDCLRCTWKNACHNGCTDYRDNEEKYLFCESRKEIFNHLIGKIGGLK